MKTVRSLRSRRGIENSARWGYAERMAMNKGGRPNKDQVFQKQLEDAIERIANGETLSAVASTLHKTTNMLRSAILADPDLRERWMIAKEMRAHALYDEAIDLSRRLSSRRWSKDQTSEVTALRVAIDTLKHAASRFAPIEYGDKAPAHPVVPIQIITNLDLGQKNAPPPLAQEDVYTITAPAQARLPSRGEAEHEPALLASARKKEML